MSKVKKTKKTIKSRIEAIKKINDDPRKIVDDIYDKYLTDLSTTDQLFKTTFGALSEKRKRKKENKKDIFAEIVDTVEGFLGIDEPGKPITNSRERLRQYTQEATKKTLLDTQNIILNAAKEIFFAGDGVCGTNRNISTSTTLYVKPKEFDIMNVLSVSPESNTGQIMYELISPEKGYIKMNRKLYDTFTGTTNFTSISGTSWYDITWDNSLQQYEVVFDNTNPYIRVDEFLNDYYSSIELPDITGVTKTAMLLLLKGDDSNTSQFDIGLNDVERLLSKLTSICSNPTNPISDLQQNPVDQFNENDEDIEFYFDFDDVEGIDLDDEDSRLRKVMKYKDCGNFEVPVNKNIYEGFVYLSKKKNLNDVVDNTLNKLAKDAQLQNSSLQLESLKFSLLSDFIFKLPKALLTLILSPKLILPVVLIYKYFKSAFITATTTIKDIMKDLRKFFNKIIKDVFWKFLTEFWLLVKRDLLAFLVVIVQKIIKNKYKRYVTIITALIFLLKKILETGLDNCQDIFNTILNTINNALSTSVPINVPGLLLSMSDMLPGYSQDRAAMNVNERLSSLGFDMGPIFGEENKLPLLIKSIIDGNQEELDTNSFIKITLKPGILPGPTGGSVIPPGLISGTGKLF